MDATWYTPSRKMQKDHFSGSLAIRRTSVQEQSTNFNKQQHEILA